MEDLIKDVARSLGYSMIKKEQLDIVTAFLLGRDVFAVLPIEFGKSLCYAVLPGSFNLLEENNHLSHFLLALKTSTPQNKQAISCPNTTWVYCLASKAGFMK